MLKSKFSDFFCGIWKLERVLDRACLLAGGKQPRNLVLVALTIIDAIKIRVILEHVTGKERSCVRYGAVARAQLVRRNSARHRRGEIYGQFQRRIGGLAGELQAGRQDDALGRPLVLLDLGSLRRHGRHLRRGYSGRRARLVFVFANVAIRENIEPIPGKLGWAGVQQRIDRRLSRLAAIVVAARSRFRRLALAQRRFGWLVQLVGNDARDDADGDARTKIARAAAVAFVTPKFFIGARRRRKQCRTGR
jgi:hypothetical protein